MSKLLVSETFINATRGYQFGNSEPYEPYTDNVGCLFKDMQKEYGRCVSKVYIDREDGVTAVGWVFQKTMEYEDARRDQRKEERQYIREVWVNLYEECQHGDPDELQRTHGRSVCHTGIKYHTIGKA